ncbi:MAG TPA: pteridine-dependent deoxygenase [Rudaea sp.]|jgi:chorismate lyase/3-hydroxybenzoate synthase
MTEFSLSADLDVRIPEHHASARLSPLQLRYERDRLETLLSAADVLAVIGFGAGALTSHDDARYLHIPLEPVAGLAPFEVWRGTGSVRRGRNGPLRWAGNGDYSFAVLEVDEDECGGLLEAARVAYRDLGDWLAESATPHVLRIWNYLDAINEGEGDAERYREFCRGRAEGMRAAFKHGFPAATAIGVRDGRRVLRVYFIAARVRGGALENPRQLSAWRYPRQYGPSAPTFARAMHAPTVPPQLYISGTAAIVGHASHHPGDFTAQVDETLANFASLLAAAGLPAALHFGPGSTLKVYVRRAADAGRAAALMSERLPAETSLLLLHGDICRRELLIEIDGVQTS